MRQPNSPERRAELVWKMLGWAVKLPLAVVMRVLPALTFDSS